MAWSLQKKTDAVYVTRFQKERWTEKERPYPKIDAKFLREGKYSHASVMHPLPRVNELDAALDNDRRAIYFRQAAYGVPVRMALISLLLHLHRNKSLHKFAGGFAKPAIRSMRSRSDAASIAPIQTASATIRPSGNTPPTSSTSSRKTPRNAVRCAASIARPTSKPRPRRSSWPPIRRERHLRPGLARWCARPRKNCGISLFIAAMRMQRPPALRPRPWKKGWRRIISPLQALR